MLITEDNNLVFQCDNCTKRLVCVKDIIFAIIQFNMAKWICLDYKLDGLDHYCPRCQLTTSFRLN